MHPLNTMVRPPSSSMGCDPASERWMMLSRRCPSATQPPFQRPLPSGPREAMAPMIFRTASPDAALPLNAISPAMPHMLIPRCLFRVTGYLFRFMVFFAHHADGFQRWICGVREDHSCFHAAPQIVDGRLVDPFARKQERDAGRVGCCHFRRDPARRFLHGND